jgi:hypothetical protein
MMEPQEGNQTTQQITNKQQNIKTSFIYTVTHHIIIHERTDQTTIQSQIKTIEQNRTTTNNGSVRGIEIHSRHCHLSIS